MNCAQLLKYLSTIDDSICRQKPVGGDLTYIRQQLEDHQVGQGTVTLLVTTCPILY